MQGQPDSSPVSRRQSYDDMPFMDSPLSVVSMEEERCLSGDWIDKVMVKNQGGLSGEDGSESISYQKNIRDTLREKSLENGVVGNHSETDDLEIENSDSSEVDYECRVNVPKLNFMPNGGGTKLRKPTQNLKQIKTKFPETRSIFKSFASVT